MPYLCQLEPDVLLEQFIAHPPVGFVTGLTPSGLPFFRAPFDLLSTADDALRRRVSGLPLYRQWSQWLRWQTHFAGCTATEYLPLPPAPPAVLVRELKAHCGRRDALLIVKDLAHASPLLAPADNAHAAAFAEACQAEGFVLLEGMPLAWVAIDFVDEDAYLQRLSASRRKDIRRKLRARAGLEVEVLATGDARFFDPAALARFDALYRNVYAQSAIHFDELAPAFLSALLQDAASGGRVFVYRHGGDMIGWNLCYEHAGKLIDKYVGFDYPQAREHNLYAVSWMHNLAYARQRGLSHYVAGWTDPEIKSYLGARLTRTRHAVYARNPLLRALLRRMAHHFEAEPADAATDTATDTAA